MNNKMQLYIGVVIYIEKAVLLQGWCAATDGEDLSDVFYFHVVIN